MSIVPSNRKLIIDTRCEVYDLIKHRADGIFWNLKQHELVPGAIYVIGRQQVLDNRAEIRELALKNTIKIVISNPHEGSITLVGVCQQAGLLDLVQTGQILILGGGDMDASYTYLQYDSFLPKIYDYKENVAAAQLIDSFYTDQKPYKFLFMNGRARPNRKYLLERFRSTGLLDHAIWSNLDSFQYLDGCSELELWHNDTNLMLSPSIVQSMPKQYEYARYRKFDAVANTDYKKHALFNGEWGEVYLEPAAYQDSYFSMVTETVFTYPYSFRTEKICKPVAIGHPFVVSANRGYYRDLHNLGFKTFGHVIDQSFDQIDNNQDRIERTAELVEDLCNQDLASFMNQCYTVCKYNQQHLAHMSVQVRKELPDRFFAFLQKYINE